MKAEMPERSHLARSLRGAVPVPAGLALDHDRFHLYGREKGKVQASRHGSSHNTVQVKWLPGKTGSHLTWNSPR